MPRYLSLLALCFGAFLPLYTAILSFQILCIVTSVALLFRRSLLVRTIGLMSVGAIITTWQLQSVIDSQLPKSLEKVDLLVTLSIEDGVAVSGNTLRFKGRVLTMDRTDTEVCEKCDDMIGRIMRLSWRRYGELPSIVAGQQWTLMVRLKRPRGFVNPDGFDYQAWLLSTGVLATGYVRKSTLTHLNVSGDARVPFILRIRRSISDVLDDFKHAALLKALMVGDKSEISREQWAVFRMTGTLHLMAISGLHIGLIAIIGFVVARVLLGVFPLSYSVGVVRGISAVASIMLSGCYVALSGYGIPAQRAWWAVVLVGSLYIFGRRINPFYLLLYVVLCVVLLNPLAPTQNGFWLSFGAVMVLMLGFAFRSRGENWILGLFRAQVVITIGLPIMLIALHLPISASGFLANVVAVPAISFVVMPLLFFSALLATLSAATASVFIYIADGSMHVLWMYLSWLSTFEGELWFSVRSSWLLFVAGAAVALLLMPKAFKLFPIAGVFLLTVWFSHALQQQKVNAILTVLDVGQGLSVVINSGGKTLVYDTGARLSDNFDVGSGVVAPFLRSKNIRKIDTIVISHGDNDHAGGLSGLVEQLPYTQILSNHHDKARLAEPCVSGRTFFHEAIKYTVLWPQIHTLGDSSSNNDSCVLLVEVADLTILLAGDIEKEVELALVNGGHLPKDIDILIAPHHGSNTSSSSDFLKWLNPKDIVVSAGYLNRYRHPSKAVLRRYENIGARVWNTAVHGAVTVELESDHISRLFSERERASKPWFD
ncbi:MAG: DNA internalization-related competence protein ComEC/Rec2 [Agarilytica sp.]